MNANGTNGPRRRWRAAAAGGGILVGLAVTLLAALGGCGRGRPERAPAPAAVAGMESRGMAADEAAMSAPASMAPDVPAPPTAPPGTPRTLIRNASLVLVVADVDSAAAAAEREAVAAGGFLAAASAQRFEGFPQRQLTLRVPATKLDGVLARLRALALQVENESLETQDVTDQVVDLDARLRTLRATEVELLGLLRETRGRGGKTEDVMAVFRELTGIRTQIEQLDGQRRTLGELAALSTVHATFVADAASRPIADGGWRPGATVRNSLRLLAAALRGLGDGAIFAAVVLLPLVVLAAVLVGLVARLAGAVRARIGRRPPA